MLPAATAEGLTPRQPLQPEMLESRTEDRALQRLNLDLQNIRLLYLGER
jgi:hypothetical protein